VYDGIEFEKRGLPAVAILTRPFVVPGRQTARIRGLPDYPVLFMEHPIGRTAHEMLILQAQKILPEILQVLTS
jgi:hypothetical protein